MPKELTKKKYSKVKDWSKAYPDGKIKLKISRIHKSWKKLFKEIKNDEKFDKILIKTLTECSDKKLLPYPKYIFNAFKLTSFDNLKVVFIGQDPYFNIEKYKQKEVPQAMGLSFSVPHDFDIPSSLDNIYKNLVKYKHIKNKPSHGNLEKWAKQGCLLLNTALTVIEGKDNINCHKNIWKWVTDKIIKYISDNKDNVVFVLWGSNAYEKINLIDLDKHEAIISSHPSGLSASKPMKNYPAFNDEDHFGKINEYLEKWKMEKIDWSLE